VRYSDFDVGPEEGFYRPTDLSRFVVLREEEVYEPEERVSIPTHLVSMPRTTPFPEITLVGGTHLLHIAVGLGPTSLIRSLFKTSGRAKVFCVQMICSPSLCHSPYIPDPEIPM
jgi:hypothetical protein